MAEIKGEYVMMMDSLVNSAVRQICREASGLDFDNLEGQWVPQDSFNAYLEKLRERVGEQGPYIVGTRIPGQVDKLMGLRKNFPTLQDVVLNWGDIYLANNRGENVGYYKVKEYREGEITAEVTSLLDEGFHLGVLAGAVKLYTNRLVNSDIVQSIKDTGMSVYKYTWRP